MAHSTQRYNTAGDFFDIPGDITFFRISDMGNEDYNFLIAIHELIEAHLCRKRNISFESIDHFDMNNLGLDDPGSSKKAPYHLEHMFALKIEKIIARELKVNWKKYEKRMEEVCV